MQIQTPVAALPGGGPHGRSTASIVVWIACVLLLLGASPLYAQAPPSANLIVSTRTLGAIRPGANVAVLIEVENRGPSEANSILLAVDVSLELEVTGASLSFLTNVGSCAVYTFSDRRTVLCNIDRLFSGHYLTGRVTGRVVGAVNSEFSVRGDIRSAWGDPNTQDNVIDVRRLVQDGTERADLDVSVVDPPGATPVGSVQTFRMRAQNLGPSVAGVTHAAVIFPNYAAAASVVAPPGWVCKETFDPITIPPPTDSFDCERYRFDPGTVEFVLTLGTSESSATYEVGLGLDSDTIDPNEANNLAIATITVLPQGGGSSASVPAASPQMLVLLALLLAAFAFRATVQLNIKD